ncbi:MAG: hypothetical protein KDK36_21005 [Leptospiraceae bacterium]|nr:hypothetical protein [Leptospiraceae bacterium]
MLFKITNKKSKTFLLFVKGDYIYVADWGNAEFQIINASDKYSPTYLSGANNSGNPLRVYI